MSESIKLHEEDSSAINEEIRQLLSTEELLKFGKVLCDVIEISEEGFDDGPATEQEEITIEEELIEFFRRYSLANSQDLKNSGFDFCDYFEQCYNDQFKWDGYFPRAMKMYSVVKEMLETIEDPNSKLYMVLNTIANQIAGLMIDEVDPNDLDEFLRRQVIGKHHFYQISGDIPKKWTKGIKAKDRKKIQEQEAIARARFMSDHPIDVVDNTMVIIEAIHERILESNVLGTETDVMLGGDWYLFCLKHHINERNKIPAEKRNFETFLKKYSSPDEFVKEFLG